MQKKENLFVLNVNYGGLGDHLFLSPLPRLYKMKFPDSKFFISNHSKFRSESVRDLVWNKNPYIDGYSNDYGFKLNYLNDYSNRNILAKLATSAGIYVDQNIEPEIYFNYQLIEEFSNKLILDLNYTSFVGAYSKKKILLFLEGETDILLINPPKWLSKFALSVSTLSLEHYVNIIYSCKTFICFTSGGATLASAIGKPSVCFYGYGQNKIFHHSQMHSYINMAHDSIILNIFHSIFLRLKNRLRTFLSIRS
jgi:hypothetical protein